MKEIFISLESNILTGDVLDVCGEGDEGIIYNVYKSNNSDYSINYNKKNSIGGKYDIILMFFSLNKLSTSMKKSKLLASLNSCLKENGVIYIWDIDKAKGQVFNGNIKVSLPNKKIKNMKIREYNIFKDNSNRRIQSIIKEYFDIIHFKASDGIYYIECTKKAT